MSRRFQHHRAVTAEESALWRRVVRDAVPLHEPDPSALPPAVIPEPPSVPVEPPAASPAPVPASRMTARATVLRPLSPEATPGLDRQTDKKLRRGLMAIEGRIDLHGMTQAEAHAAVAAFIDRGWREDRRCLLVITGKGAMGSGGGILRQAVPRWLNEPPLRGIIVGLHRAQAKHGGDGALYVLLKRRRENP